MAEVHVHGAVPRADRTAHARRVDHGDVSAIISPGLVVFRELVAANVDRMIEIARDPQRLRPHCKTHKMREVAEMQLARGITKHKAATIAEAEMLAQAGVKDVFLAYNIVGPNIARSVEYRFYINPDVQMTLERVELFSGLAIPADSPGR